MWMLIRTSHFGFAEDEKQFVSQRRRSFLLVFELVADCRPCRNEFTPPGSWCFLFPPWTTCRSADESPKSRAVWAVSRKLKRQFTPSLSYGSIWRLASYLLILTVNAQTTAAILEDETQLVKSQASSSYLYVWRGLKKKRNWMKWKGEKLVFVITFDCGPSLASRSLWRRWQVCSLLM